MNIRLFFTFLSFLSISTLSIAQTTQTTHTDPQTGVKITTTVRPIASLSEQVKDLEEKLANARLQPELIDNGTVAKYEAALRQRRQQLEEENAVRTAPVQTKSK